MGLYKKCCATAVRNLIAIAFASGLFEFPAVSPRLYLRVTQRRAERNYQH
jgi:hypothetical protein